MKFEAICRDPRILSAVGEIEWRKLGEQGNMIAYTHAESWRKYTGEW